MTIRERLGQRLSDWRLGLGSRIAGISLEDLRHHWSWSTGWGAQTQAGIRINSETALRSSIIHACVRILSNTVAMLPMKLYERLPNRRRRLAEEQELYRVIHDEPNEYQTPFEWKREKVVHLATNGNAYDEIVPSGRRMQLWPIHPAHLRVDWLDRKSGRRKIYDVSSQHDGRARVLSNTDVWHSHLMSLNAGLTGANPIDLAAEGIGHAIAAQIYSARALGKGSMPAGVVSGEQKVTDPERKAMMKHWEEIFGGIWKTHQTAFLGSGRTYTPITFSARQSQLNETMRWSAGDLARIYGIPLHLLQETERSTSWGTGIEHLGIGFVTYTMAPYFVAIEEGLTRAMITDPRRYYVEFLVDALLRADLSSRFEAYAQAVNANNPWLTRNEIRLKENMEPDPTPDGQRFLVPQNNMGPGARAGRGSNGTSGIVLTDREWPHDDRRSLSIGG